MDDPKPVAVALYRARSRQRCSELALVLNAIGIDCAIRPLESEFVLIVDALDAARARRQLRGYLHENRRAAPRFDDRGKVADGAICASLYGATILLVDLLQRFEPAWRAAGKANAGLIRQGEWWRAVTALSLHVGPLHLAGNLVSGVLFGFLAGRLLGGGLALCSILLAGTMGNLLNAVVQPAGHTSVGASTAVFASLGILTTYAWKRRQRSVNRWLPVGGGIALLAFLGMGGGRTDILAHLAGFASGALLGVVYIYMGYYMEVLMGRQRTAGIAALIVFVAAWCLALLTRG